jgi:signal transduction histidine kinase/CheY-like chemotaxis protein
MGSTQLTTPPNHPVRRGGWIDLSGRDGQGARDATEVSEAQGALTTGARASARILVVEDEHLVALDILQVVARLGHRSVVAYSGEEAIRKGTATPFDLVLMDVKLKGSMDGIEAAQKIRASRDVPIIYLTAYADDGTLERAQVTEPHGYVVKPFNERELTAAISMTLQRHALERLRSEQQRLRQFLGDATALLAASLDYRVVARGAAELIVPRYADWCLVHLEDSEHGIPSFTCTRPEGAEDGETDAAETPRLIDAVERNVRAELQTQVTDAMLLDHLGPQHFAVVRELGPRSLLCVPLVARGRRLGAISLIAGSSRAPYGAAELSFIEDFADRLGMALENALLYRQAERALQMRDDVLAIVSHDLRSPLSAIMLRARMIAMRPDTGNTADSIVRSAKQMNRLIDDLLDASAINGNGGKLALDTGVHGAAELVRDAIEMFRLQAEAAAITLTDEPPDSSVRVVCDRGRIVQVLSNLIGNALKFTPEHGRVTIRAELRDSEVRFEVRDTGCGIAPEQIAHLFERFWRAQNRRDGVGLGLFIANGIIASHGSALGVESTPGAGTTFFFSLPASSG